MIAFQPNAARILLMQLHAESYQLIYYCLQKDKKWTPVYLLHPQCTPQEKQACSSSQNILLKEPQKCIITSEIGSFCYRKLCK